MPAKGKVLLNVAQSVSPPLFRSYIIARRYREALLLPLVVELSMLFWCFGFDITEARKSRRSILHVAILPLDLFSY